MRILHFLTNSSIGGGQVAVASLIDALRKLDQNVVMGIVLPDGGLYVDRFRSAGYETITLPLSSLMVSSRSIRKIVDRFVPNVIHTHGKGAGFHVRRTFEPNCGIGVVHNYHGFHPPDSILKRQLYLQLEDAMARRSGALICVSESEANEVHRSLPQARGRIEVVQNCIDRAKTFQDSRSRLPDQLTAWFAKQKNRRVISMIARADPVKNHDLAITAAIRVLQHSSRYAFLFVGLPPADRRFRALSSRFGDLVHAEGSLPSAAPVIKRSWALFLPSKKEGSPLVILEGFALGVPTIGTRAPGITDILQDSWNGFLMDPIEDGLLNIILRTERSPEVFEAAQRGAREQGTYLRMRIWARQYLDIYRRTAGMV